MLDLECGYVHVWKAFGRDELRHRSEDVLSGIWRFSSGLRPGLPLSILRRLTSNVRFLVRIPLAFELSFRLFILISGSTESTSETLKRELGSRFHVYLFLLQFGPSLLFELTPYDHLRSHHHGIGVVSSESGNEVEVAAVVPFHWKISNGFQEFVRESHVRSTFELDLVMGALGHRFQVDSVIRRGPSLYAFAPSTCAELDSPTSTGHRCVHRQGILIARRIMDLVGFRAVTARDSLQRLDVIGDQPTPVRRLRQVEVGQLHNSQSESRIVVVAVGIPQDDVISQTDVVYVHQFLRGRSVSSERWQETFGAGYVR